MNRQTYHDLGGFIILDPVQIANEETFNLVMDTLEKNPDILETSDSQALNTKIPSNFIMRPLHQDHNPIILDDRHMALIWYDADNPDNASTMISLILEIEQSSNNSWRKTPCGIIAGHEFQGFFQYRRSCCGDNQTGLSVMAFIMNDINEVEHTIRDPLNLTNSHKKLFEQTKGGILISTGSLEHILHHHRHPDQPCNHSHSDIPTNSLY